MLSQIKIENYRSLENVDAVFAPLTAIVGPNGSGKTSILRALSCLFGEAWPSIRSFRIPQDFTNFETSRSIAITGTFAPDFTHTDALNNDHQIVALRLTCKPYKRSGRWGEAGDLHADFEPLGPDGETPSVAITPPRKGVPPTFRPLSVTGDLRDHSRILIVDHRRNVAQHLPHLRGSVLGRLLEPARRDFDRQADFKAAYDAALQILRTDTVREIEEKVQATAKRMLGFLGREAGKTLDIGFGFADPANPFNTLRLEYREGGRAVPGDELGLGIQSAVVVGIFEAFRQLGGGIQTVVIEEPEMYLHPQAQRYFHRLLCEMADSGTCQVIYATHSPIFADVNRFESLRLVRREPGRHSTLSYVRDADVKALSEDRDREKLAGKFDATRNEVLFASRALLVEGQGDRTAALMVAEKLKVDVDAEGVAIVDCGGKTAIPLVTRVCRSLEIPFAVLHDEDIWAVKDAQDPVKQGEENKRAEVENKRIADAVGTAGTLSIAKPSLEALLDIGKSAKDKPLRIVEKMQGIVPTDIPAPLLEAVMAVLPTDTAAAQASKHSD